MKNSKEIEVKFRVQKLGGYREKLKKLQAQLEWMGKEKNIYFERNDAYLEQGGKVLRVREWPGHSASITSKSSAPKTSGRRYDERREEQTDIADFASMCRILEMIGFDKVLVYEKKREHWKLGKVSIELDRLHGRSYVEIEGTKKQIDKIARLLGLDWEDRESRSYYRIARERQRKSR